MKPTTLVAEATAPDGAHFQLYKHDRQFYLNADGRQVMSTNLIHSERLLADLGCRFEPPIRRPRVLIGGLGLGFSLRRALEITGVGARVEVAELLPDVIRWNREELDGLNDDILADPRTEIFEGDVFTRISQAAKPENPTYDAILLDVDDGPTSLIQKGNWQLYDRSGLATIQAALSALGRRASWAASVEPKLRRSLRKASCLTEEVEVAKHPRATREEQRIYVAAMRG